jgi:hypothetical protein
MPFSGEYGLFPPVHTVLSIDQKTKRKRSEKKSMSKKTDWFPSARGSQLAMARNWAERLGVKKAEWGIPDAFVTGFTNQVNAAQAALDTAANEATRTTITNALCREAFKALEDTMRDAKRRYFLQPPLLDSDIISLELKPRDNHPTPTGSPAAQVTVETFLTGRHELGIRIVYITGSPDDPASKGCRIWYSVVAPGGTPPANPDDLRKSFYTKRRKDVIEFDFDASGSTCFMAVQVENDGKKGPWGPIISALIP